MTVVKNAHGLDRNIPAAVKREIRQRDGFGCVMCGLAFITYEHVDPKFADAKEHDPLRMTLLCGSHQLASSSGRLPAAVILNAMEQPASRKAGFSRGGLEYGIEHPVIRLGATKLVGATHALRFRKRDLVRVYPPEEEGAPYRLSVFLSNRDGTEVFRLEKNEWVNPVSNWDVQTSGTKIIIHNGPGDIALVIQQEPPKEFVIERLEMFLDGFPIRITPDELVLGTASIIGGTFETAGIALDADGTIIIGGPMQPRINVPMAVVIGDPAPGMRVRVGQGFPTTPLLTDHGVYDFTCGACDYVIFEGMYATSAPEQFPTLYKCPRCQRVNAVT